MAPKKRPHKLKSPWMKDAFSKLTFEENCWSAIRIAASLLIGPEAPTHLNSRPEDVAIYRIFCAFTKEVMKIRGGLVEKDTLGMITNDFTHWYTLARKGKVTPQYAYRRILIVTALLGKALGWKIRGKDLSFLMPTKRAFEEEGGPAELAKLNVGILGEMSQRRVHALRKDFNKVMAKKEVAHETLVAEMLKNLFWVPAERAEELSIEFSKYKAKRNDRSFR